MRREGRAVKGEEECGLTALRKAAEVSAAEGATKCQERAPTPRPPPRPGKLPPRGVGRGAAAADAGAAAEEEWAAWPAPPLCPPPRAPRGFFFLAGPEPAFAAFTTTFAHSAWASAQAVEAVMVVEASSSVARERHTWPNSWRCEGGAGAMSKPPASITIGRTSRYFSTRSFWFHPTASRRHARREAEREAG